MTSKLIGATQMPLFCSSNARKTASASDRFSAVWRSILKNSMCTWPEVTG